jgi:calcineurin-like phosphoesterase
MQAATVVINRRALRHNLQRLRELAPASKLVAVVKANAYGHGLIETARTLPDADAFGVARLEEALRLREAGVAIIFVDIHAETTSEKIALGWALDGKVSVVAGTHTHVQTADERVLPGGTGCLTDAGMCGPEESVLGRAVESVVWRFRTGMPTRFPIAGGPVRLCGLVAEIDAESGRCQAIHRFNRLLPPRDGVVRLAQGGL